MSKNLIQLILILLFICLCFFGGIYLASLSRKKKQKAKKRDPNTLPMSAFSTFDHPALMAEPAEIDPLAEAKLFLVYGKAANAKDVLNQALLKGRLTRQQVEEFWAKNPQ